MMESRPISASAAAPAGGWSWLPLIPAALFLWWTVALAAADKPFTPLDWVNLAFHEAGHLIFSPFGQTLHVLGGTILQLLVPLILAGWFLIKHRRPSGTAVCSWWFGESLVNVSVYMADAREMTLDLVGGGEHDWTQLFYQFGLLGEEPVRVVSALTHHLGVALMLAATAWIACFAFPASMRESIAARFGFPRRVSGDRSSGSAAGHALPASGRRTTEPGPR
jgi:hypothetical protein